MSLLEIKQQLSRLSERDRDEVFAYLRRLRETASSRGEVFAGRIRKMQEGHFTTVEELEKKTEVM